MILRNKPFIYACEDMDLRRFDSHLNFMETTTYEGTIKIA